MTPAGPAIRAGAARTSEDIPMTHATHHPPAPGDEPPKPIEPEMPLGEPPAKPDEDGAVEDVKPDQTRF